MTFLRRLFEDPNGKAACTDCGAQILNRTARETGGFCKPCHVLGPDLRASRAAFEASLADGSAFRLRPEERASSHPLTTRMPDPARWRLSEDDVPHKADKTIDGMIDAVAKGDQPALYLHAPEDRLLQLDTRGPNAVLALHGPDRSRYLHGPMAATGQVAAADQVWSTCPCCGDGMTTLPSRFHLPRQAALSAVSHILTGHAPAHMVWVEADPPSWTRPGRG